eukprot:6438517-Prymnesium_polylepis.1
MSPSMMFNSSTSWHWSSVRCGRALMWTASVRFIVGEKPLQRSGGEHPHVERWLPVAAAGVCCCRLASSNGGASRAVHLVDLEL